MQIDMQQIVNDYQNDPHVTSKLLADRYGLKVVDVQAILRLNGVKMRRGNTLLNEGVRQQAMAVIKAKKLRAHLRKLHAEYGYDLVAKVLRSLEDEANDAGE